MAISAYVFVECLQGKALAVTQKMTELEGVQHAHTVTGPVDVIAFIQAPDINELGKFVVERIQSINGVLRTSTNIVTS